MCTVSWLAGGDGYTLRCNRDEKRRRAPASSPRMQRTGGLRVIAPKDPEGGGTWISVNECGLSLCLLNGAPGGEGSVSRGLLVSGLAALPDGEAVAEAMAARDLQGRAAFTLLVLEPGSDGLAFEWDGQLLRRRQAVCSPLISSSFDPDGVRESRLRAFKREPDLERFHASHGERASAYSPCMHREDAETVSFSRIEVTKERVRFSYRGSAPCRPGLVETLEMVRRCQ
ncbi:MAG: NRDE family protein [Bryobacteraceae bacterium]|nr:NRDE family protein [Bryobacteraceae bacterium]